MDTFSNKNYLPFLDEMCLIDNTCNHFLLSALDLNTYLSLSDWHKTSRCINKYISSSSWSRFKSSGRQISSSSSSAASSLRPTVSLRAGVEVEDEEFSRRTKIRYEPRHSLKRVSNLILNQGVEGRNHQYSILAGWEAFFILFRAGRGRWFQIFFVLKGRRSGRR